MSDTTPTPDPDGAIYPDGAAAAGEPDSASPDAKAVGENGPDVVNPADMPFWTPSADPDLHRDSESSARPSDMTSPAPRQATAQVNGEMLIANLLVEIANLTKRAIMAETMVQMYQQAAQPKSAQ